MFTALRCGKNKNMHFHYFSSMKEAVAFIVEKA